MSTNQRAVPATYMRGGTYSSTSKVVLVDEGRNNEVTCWFGQVSIDQVYIDWNGNCGNLTTALGPGNKRLVQGRG